MFAALVPPNLVFYFTSTPRISQPWHFDLVLDTVAFLDGLDWPTSQSHIPGAKRSVCWHLYHQRACFDNFYFPLPLSFSALVSVIALPLAHSGNWLVSEQKGAALVSSFPLPLVHSGNWLVSEQKRAGEVTTSTLCATCCRTSKASC